MGVAVKVGCGVGDEVAVGTSVGVDEGGGASVHADRIRRSAIVGCQRACDVIAKALFNLRRFDQSCEQAAHHGMLLGHNLGVPLYTEAERVGGCLQTFNDPIGRASAND